MHRVEFNLSFENYLDWQGLSSEPRPSKLVRGMLVYGLFFILMGFFFTRWAKDTAPAMGVLAIAVGLFLTAASVPLWFILSRQDPRKKLELHRDIFDRFYRQPRQLEFDETGWTFTYGNAVNSRPWEDLTLFRDLGRTIVLADTFVHYPLAASAFTQEQRDQLKKLCEDGLYRKSSLFSVPMSCTAAVYVRSMIAHRWRHQTFRMVALHVLGSFVALLTAIVWADTFSSGALAIALIVGLLLFLGGILYDSRKFNSYRARYVFEAVEFSPDSLCFRNPLQLYKVRLSWLVEAREARGEFRLYIGDDHFYLISKRAFSQEQLHQFRDLLSPNQMAAAAGAKRPIK